MQYFILFLSLIFFSGCAATQPYMTDPAHSDAWNVTRAAGAEWLKDVTKEQFDAAQTKGQINYRGSKADGATVLLAEPLVF